ncbi:hypothetical protein ACOSQ4_019937 [Xanthoceras sorbifolium]
MRGVYLPFVSYLSQQRVQPQFSCAYIHAKNGVVERKHRHLVETGLILLAHAKMPLRFWFESFSTTCFLVNSLPISLLQFQVPFEKLFHKAPNYNYLPMFGCSLFPYLRDNSNNKLDFNTTKYVFIGYSLNHKGYCCLHPSGKVFIKCHAEFNELDFPYVQLFSSATGSVPNPEPAVLLHSIVDLVTPTQQLPHVNLGPPSAPTDSTLVLQREAAVSVSNSAQQACPPAQFNVHPMMTRSKHGIFKPKTYTSTWSLPSVFLAETEPRTVKETLSSPAWKVAMQDEYSALLRDQT